MTPKLRAWLWTAAGVATVLLVAVYGAVLHFHRPSLGVGADAPPLVASQWLNVEGPPPAATAPGRVRVIDFSGSWCGPCRRAMPALEQLWERFAPDVDVVMATNETAEQVGPFVRAEHFQFPIACDPERKTVAAFGVSFWPTTFVVGKDGHIAYEGLPFFVDDEVRRALGTSPAEVAGRGPVELDEWNAWVRARRFETAIDGVALRGAASAVWAAIPRVPALVADAAVRAAHEEGAVRAAVFLDEWTFRDRAEPPWGVEVLGAYLSSGVWREHDGSHSIVFEGEKVGEADLAAYVRHRALRAALFTALAGGTALEPDAITRQATTREREIRDELRRRPGS